MSLPSAPLVADQPINFDWQQWADRVDATVEAQRNYGPTANRPTAKNAYIGMRYFDQGLGANGGRPIWASVITPTTVTWVDADGATV